MDRKKKFLTATLLFLSVIFASCNSVKKIERQTKIADGKASKPKVSGPIFETKSISQIRDGAGKSMEVFGTDSSKYGNIGKTGIVPIITDKDEIYNIKLEKSDGNELTDGNSWGDMLTPNKVTNSYSVYRNDKEKIKTRLNIKDGTDIGDLINFTENYMDTTYNDSPFKYLVENVQVTTTSDKQDFVSVAIRPSYDGVVFIKTYFLKNGLPENIPRDFTGGNLGVMEMNKIYSYSGISPYYNVEKQGEAISEILSIESVLSIVANKINKDKVNDIKLFELAYRLNRDYSAVPVWNIVIDEAGNGDRNFQIDAVKGDVFFE